MFRGKIKFGDFSRSKEISRFPLGKIFERRGMRYSPFTAGWLVARPGEYVCSLWASCFEGVNDHWCFSLQLEKIYAKLSLCIYKTVEGIVSCIINIFQKFCTKLIMKYYNERIQVKYLISFSFLWNDI